MEGDGAAAALLRLPPAAEAAVELAAELMTPQVCSWRSVAVVGQVPLHTCGALVTYLRRSLGELPCRCVDDAAGMSLEQVRGLCPHLRRGLFYTPAEVSRRAPSPLRW